MGNCPNLKFCPKREVSANVRFREGWVGSFPETYTDPWFVLINRISNSFNNLSLSPFVQWLQLLSMFHLYEFLICVPSFSCSWGAHKKSWSKGNQSKLANNNMFKSHRKEQSASFFPTVHWKTHISVGLPYEMDREWLLKMLNYTPKEDWSGHGPSYLLPLKDTKNIETITYFFHTSSHATLKETLIAYWPFFQDTLSKTNSEIFTHKYEYPCLFHMRVHPPRMPTTCNCVLTYNAITRMSKGNAALFAAINNEMEVYQLSWLLFCQYNFIKPTILHSYLAHASVHFFFSSFHFFLLSQFVH